MKKRRPKYKILSWKCKYVTDRSFFRDRRVPHFDTREDRRLDCEIVARKNRGRSLEARRDLSRNRRMEFARYERERQRRRSTNRRGNVCLHNECSPINQSIREGIVNQSEASRRTWNVISFRGWFRSFLRSVHVNWPRRSLTEYSPNGRERGEKQELLS